MAVPERTSRTGSDAGALEEPLGGARQQLLYRRYGRTQLQVQALDDNVARGDAGAERVDLHVYSAGLEARERAFGGGRVREPEAVKLQPAGLQSDRRRSDVDGRRERLLELATHEFRGDVRVL